MDIDCEREDKKRKVEGSKTMNLEEVLKAYAIATSDLLEVIVLLGQKVLQLENEKQ